MFTVLIRIFRSGWRSFYRDREIALATIFVLFLSVILSGSFFLFKDISQILVADLQEKIDVSVYFKEETPEEDILGVGKELSELPEIKNIEYVSKKQALLNFIQRHERDTALLDSIDELGKNPFLASLNVRTWNPDQYAKVSKFLEGPGFDSFVEKIDYYQRKPAIDTMRSLNSAVTKISISIAVLLVTIAIAVSLNTIGLSIYNSRKEIEIQKLVGASSWFIRGPFLVQGMICGILAALISILTISLICWFLSPRIENFFLSISLFTLFIENFWMLVLIQFTTGISLGAVSSLVAIKKYLKD